MPPSSTETSIEIMVPLTPEGMAKEAMRQGFATDYEAERIRYYNLFIAGKNAEIARLRGKLNALLD